MRQAAAALGQTKTEKALGWAGLGWAGLGWAGRHQRPGRAAAGRLCGDSLVLAAGGCGGSAEKQQSVSPTSNSQNRSPDMLSGTCYLPCHHRSASDLWSTESLLASSELSVKDKMEKINILVYFYPGSSTLQSTQKIIYFSFLNQNVIKTCTPIFQPYLSGSWEDTNLGSPQKIPSCLSPSPLGCLMCSLLCCRLSSCAGECG